MMKLNKCIFGTIALTLISCSDSEPPNNNTGTALTTQTEAECAISDADKTWLDESIQAWHFTAEHIVKADMVENLIGIFFDENCMLVTTNAMNNFGRNGADFQSTLHDGTIKLDSGTEVPVGPVSFAQAEGSNAYYVMSLPSVWRKAEVDPGNFGLEGLITGVLLHESIHLLQSPTYGIQIQNMFKKYDLPETFSDDSIQDRFDSDTDFVASVERETELFYAAAAAPDLDQTKKLAREALETMATRRARWFVGEDAYLNEAEDSWLSLEGSGQWVGYQYLIHPDGAGLTEPVIMEGFGRRGGWWTQDEGLAMALTLDALGYDWQDSAFGHADASLTSMLKLALEIE